MSNPDIALHEYLHSNWTAPYTLEWLNERCTEEEQNVFFSKLSDCGMATAFREEMITFKKGE